MADQQAPGEFHLPDLGEGLTDAEIVSWHVAEGDHVVADQPLLTVETDKAVVDIPAPHGGRVQRLDAAVGARVPVGGLLVTFAAPDAPEGALPDSGSVVGELPTAASVMRSAEQAQEPVQDASRLASQRKRASPKARQRARELGVGLESVVPTGPDATIQVRDVEAAAAAPALRSGAARPLDGVRRAMARRMADAAARVARASVTGEADISAWTLEGSPLLRLVRAVGAACRAQPLLNSSFDDATFTLSERAEVNLGVAMETADGLFVPVLKDVNAADEEQLRAQLLYLREAVERRTVKPEELRGQSITLSNFGAVGGLHAEMVVVPPQVAIVGAGRAFERAGLGPEQPVRRLLPLSVSFDHRAVTGVEACEFLVALTDDLELAR
jgi:pyruvate dehydrogenase E2 component (dihydrolipoamide acetyltransferase)